MIEVPCNTLLDHACHILAVRIGGGLQILLDGDQGSGRSHRWASV
jgi:hypothetical protein